MLCWEDEKWELVIMLRCVVKLQVLSPPTSVVHMLEVVDVLNGAESSLVPPLFVGLFPAFDF